MKALVAFDDSEQACSALEYAADIVDAVSGSLTVVYAVDPNVYDEGGTEPISSLSDGDRRLIAESIQDAEQRGLDILENAAEAAEEIGQSVDTELLYGDPVAEIPDLAESEDFDVIYVGHRGLTERADLLLGSVAKGLVERSTVPVTVVR